MFKIPLDVDENATSSLTKNSAFAKLIKTASLIIWDECCMAHKLQLKVVNNLLQDLRETETPMGGLLGTRTCACGQTQE